MFDNVGSPMACKMIKNLFPEDTRIVEFVGSVSLMLLALLISCNAIYIIDLVSIQRAEFWSLSFLVLGATQFISLIFYPKLELLRCIMSLVSGGALIWLGIITHNSVNLSDGTAILLGLSNLYSFVINTAQIRRTWAS